MAAMSQQLAANVGVPRGQYGPEYSLVVPLGMTMATASASTAVATPAGYRSDSGSSQENVDPESQDTGLTNLTWLSDLRAKDLAPFPVPPSPEDVPSSEEESDDYSILELTLTREQRLQLSPSLKRSLVELAMYYLDREVNYAMDLRKPPYSYATLILLTLLNHPQHCVPLCGVYSWIKANFRYYMSADQSWQNSIRHNLSLNPLFIKASKYPVDGRKGHCWELNHEFRATIRDHIEKLSQLGDLRIAKPKQKSSKSKKRNGASLNKKKGASKKRASHCASPSCSVGDPLRVAELDWTSLLGYSRSSTANTNFPAGHGSVHPTHSIGFSPLTSASELGHSMHPQDQPSSTQFISPILTTSLPPSVESTPVREYSLLSAPQPDNESPVHLFVDVQYDPKAILECPHPWAESKEETMYHLSAYTNGSTKWRDTPLNIR